MVNWTGLGMFIRKELTRTFRVAVQTLVTPWISALLYIFIFGRVVGGRIDNIGGVPYIEFVLPGILMMNVITSSFSHSSSSVYFQRFIKSIEEILVAPFSHLEMIVGYVTGGILRGLVVGLGIYAIAIAFGAARVEHLGLLVFYLLSISAVFSIVGILVGLWAQGFEQLSVLSTFVIMPFSFLGGVFYSVDMLPGWMQTVSHFNPFLYFIDGLRYSMIGVSDANALVGFGIIAALIVGLGGLTVHLFSIGWRIRE